jgi:acetyl esterase/lipase
MRLKGETPLPLPELLPQALETSIPSRDSGRAIPCRLIYPSSRKTPEERQKCKGTVLHIHGGGWVSKPFTNLLCSHDLMELLGSR